MTPSEVGEHVLLPWGGQRRYDLAYEEHGRLIKVQCKSGRERHGAIEFWTCSNERKARQNYREDRR